MSGSGATEKAGMLETLSKLSNPANHRPLLVNCFGQLRLQALHLIPPVSENSLIWVFRRVLRFLSPSSSPGSHHLSSSASSGIVFQFLWRCNDATNLRHLLPRFFRLAGASTSPSLCSIIVAAITLVTVVLVVLLAKNISRRFWTHLIFCITVFVSRLMMLISQAGVSACLFVVSGYFMAERFSFLREPFIYVLAEFVH